MINFFLIKHQLEKQNTEIEQLNTQKFQLDDQVEDLKSRISCISDKLENKNIDVHEDEVDNCYLWLLFVFLDKNKILLTFFF